MIQCQEFAILFIPFISASILIICCAYINNVQSYAIICKIYPFCPFFFIFAAFRQKRRPSSRFLPFQAVYFETICTSPACAKSCATLVPTTCDIGANLSQTSSVFSAASSVFSATSSVFFADSLRILRRFIRLDRHILHLAAAPIQLLRRSGCLARHSDLPVRHRANLARYQLYVDFRA